MPDEGQEHDMSDNSDTDLDFRFAISKVFPGDLNALVKNLIRITGVTDPNEAVRQVNAGEWELVRRWVVEPSGFINISLTYTHATAAECLRKGRIGYREHTESIFRERDKFFPVIERGTVVQGIIIPGHLLPKEDRRLSVVRGMGVARDFTECDPMSAHAILSQLSPGNALRMGFDRLMCMHRPIRDPRSSHHHYQVAADWSEGSRDLCALSADDTPFPEQTAFLFLKPILKSIGEAVV